MRKKEILPFETTWMEDSESIMVNEMSKNDKVSDIIYMWNQKVLNLQKQKVEWWLTEAKGTGEMLV